MFVFKHLGKQPHFLVQKAADYLSGVILHNGAFIQNGFDCLHVCLKGFAPLGVKGFNGFAHHVHFGVNVNYRGLKL